MLVIPAIDLRGGRCVRLTQGDYQREKVYEGDPSEIARQFEDAGAGMIHVVDLDAAKSGHLENLSSLENICHSISIPVEFGGGIRSISAAQEAFEAGAARVVVGTKLVTDPEFRKLMFESFGERVVAGIDARDGKVAIAGWTENSEADACELAKDLEREGAVRFIVTDITRDGALAGPNLPFLAKMCDAVHQPVIASGGVSSLEDLCSLRKLRLEGAIVGKALYEGKISLREALSA